jgi:S-sulfo-L-cysteine synthase (3-phospho-L-serine-dependent)
MRDAAVSIGAGRSQLGLIEAIHARGLAVVGVDRDPAAPGLARCAAAVRASTHEPVEVIARLMALEGFRIRAVLTQSSGAPAATAARAAAALGLAGLEPRRAELSTSKAGFAELCREARVRAPETVSVADEAALLRLPPPPLVLKPSRGRVGKHGVVLVRRVEELAGAFLRARAASLDGAVVAQEHVAGRDASTVALFREGEVRTVTTLDERVAFDPVGPGEEGGEARAAGVDVPSALEGTPAAGALRAATAALAKRLGTGMGFFSFRVPEDGEPVAIEAHLDLAGDFVTDALLARGAGIDLLGLTLDLLLDGRLPAPRRVRSARLTFLYEEDRPRLAELAGRGELVTNLPPVGTHGGGRIGYLLEKR